MGTPITGREAIIGLRRAMTWRTAVTCGVNDGILILSETLRQTVEHLDDDSAGLPFIQRTNRGKIETTGGMEAYMRYEGLDVLIALIMGQAGVPTQPNPLYPAVRQNSYVLATDPTGLFATVAMLKKSDVVFEYPSVKFNNFGLSGEMNAPVRLTTEGIANLLRLNSTVNTVSTMASVSYPDKGSRIIMDRDAYFRVNDETAPALGAGNTVFPSGFELSFTRPGEGDLTPRGEDIDEPIGEGFPEITLTLSFPRYNTANHAFFADWQASTPKKMEVYFRGAQFPVPTTPAVWTASIVYAVNAVVRPHPLNGFWYRCHVAGTSGTAQPTWPTTVGATVMDGTVTWMCMEDEYWREFRILFPNLQVVDPEAAIAGPGKIPMSLSFRVLGTDIAPAGMAGITQPFRIDVQNRRTTNPLA